MVLGPPSGCQKSTHNVEQGKKCTIFLCSSAPATKDDVDDSDDVASRLDLASDLTRPMKPLITPDDGGRRTAAPTIVITHMKVLPILFTTREINSETATEAMKKEATSSSK